MSWPEISKDAKRGGYYLTAYCCDFCGKLTINKEGKIIKMTKCKKGCCCGDAKYP